MIDTTTTTTTTTPTARATRSMSSSQFWLYTLGLLLVWSLVIASTTASATPSVAAAQPASQQAVAVKEAKNARNCKALCEHCGCLGFYCGEECICECNKDHAEDTKCIATMQSNARKLDIPFEILIQGPTANRFVRSAFQFEQDAERREAAQLFGRSRRSTVTIYKPSLLNSLTAVDEEHKLSKDHKELGGGRHKRAVGQLEWFTDLANTLVRPAPLGGAAGKASPSAITEESSSGADASGGLYKRAIDEPDRSWFTDNANLLLKPSPLFKRGRGGIGGDEDDSREAGKAMRAVEKIPQVLQETLRNIKESAIAEDLSEAVRTTFRDGTEAVRSTFRDGTEALQNSNLEFIPQHLRNDLSEALTKLKLIGSELETMHATTTTAPEGRSKFAIPWFRPVRFLHRVRQAIN